MSSFFGGIDKMDTYRDIKYLELLARTFPNRKAAAAEIINLNAVLSLPKGTEYYLSDLHGEYDAFRHMIQSASGVIKIKINEIFGNVLSGAERYHLASLIYNAKAEIARTKKNPDIDFEQWCKTSLYRLVLVAQAVASKYTRSKVRKRLPKYWKYNMEELLNSEDETNKEAYYNAIIDSIVETGMAEEYIDDLTNLISTLCVDKLHIIGDIYDRGPHPDYIMDFLMEHEDVDFQWGNHDIVWMGAAAGSWACTANILRINISYNNFDMLEIGYGINLRPLTSFANKVYGDDDCKAFWPKGIDTNEFDPVSEETAARMHKAISVIQFKVEGQRIKANPEFNLEHRLLLDKIDFEEGTVEVKGKKYPLKDANLPTIDPKDPYKLTSEEKRVIENLQVSILRSEKLQEHMKFLLSRGSLYKALNDKLMFHGCVPLDEEGNFAEVPFGGKTYSGRALFEYLDEAVREEFYNPKNDRESGNCADIMWYLWLGAYSPLFGKDQMTTFERLFIEDKKTHKELTVGYFSKRDDKEFCEKVLAEFGLDPEKSHILNGHVPVKIKDGESPIKGGGKLLVIDGGISRAYQKKTGIAGYTFIYNSWLMALAEHKPYMPLQKNGKQDFYAPKVFVVERLKDRMRVKDTDQAPELLKEIADLKALMEAFKLGHIKEKF